MNKANKIKSLDLSEWSVRKADFITSMFGLVFLFTAALIRFEVDPSYLDSLFTFFKDQNLHWWSPLVVVLFAMIAAFILYLFIYFYRNSRSVLVIKYYADSFSTIVTTTFSTVAGTFIIFGLILCWDMLTKHNKFNWWLFVFSSYIIVLGFVLYYIISKFNYLKYKLYKKLCL